MYVSCERFADIALRGQPVVVLSNNDGCVISRSNEAKQLGVPMGEPWFKVKSNPQFKAVVARSSNYELYGDLSARFHRTVAEMAAWAEIYSIDEAFIGLSRDGAEHAHAIQNKVAQCTDLPTTVGVATTKTLAKIAQRHAKDIGRSFFDISTWSGSQIDELLCQIPVGDVWGVGRRISRQLTANQVRSAWELSRLDPGQVRRKWSVGMERTVRELNGIPCIQVGFDPQPPQQILYSRMMGAVITQPDEMRLALAQYMWRATRRLRRSHQTATGMQVWFSTSHYRSNPHQERYGISLPATNDPFYLIQAAQGILPKLKVGQPYNRIGVLFFGLAPAGIQPMLFEQVSTSHVLNDAMEQLNLRFPDCIAPGVAGIRTAQRWDMHRELLSGAVTTRWDELLPVQCRSV
ncbi:MAG: Y-family DNA polymerase [Propionibacteriaceae bacterium]|nr:Y-family DNA polymerase [Propionibacteriaceae bacterium]